MLAPELFKLHAGEFCKMLADESFLVGTSAPELAIETMLNLGIFMDHLATEGAPVPVDVRGVIEQLGAKLLSTAWHVQGSWLADVAASAVRPMFLAVVRSALLYAGEHRAEPTMKGQIVAADPTKAEASQLEIDDQLATEIVGAAAATDPEHEATDTE